MNFRRHRSISDRHVRRNDRKLCSDRNDVYSDGD